MASHSDVQLVNRLLASTTPLLQPASGKCRIHFFQDSQADPHFLFPNILQGADPRSVNAFHTHFKLDGRRLWLWQQVPVGGVESSPAYMLRRTIAYDTADLTIINVEGGRKAGGATRMTIEVKGPPQESYDSSTVPFEILKQQGFDTATFPLHVKSHTDQWRIVRIFTESPSHLKNFSIPIAFSLLAGNICYHPSVDQATWVQNQHTAIACEADYTHKTLHKFHNVRAECVRILDWMLIKIRFDTPNAAENVDEQFVLSNLAQRYMIEGPAGSILSADNAEYYTTRTGTTFRFTGAVVSYDRHADCAVQLRLLQHIPKDQLSLFNKEEVSGVNLLPFFFDKTREDSDSAHSRLAEGFELEETHNLASLLLDAPQSASGLSARKIFLAGELPPIENVYDDGTQWEGRLEYPDMLRQPAELLCWNRLDQWQKEAIKNSDEYPLALIHGPPGTGKTSTVVAYIVARLTRNMHERLMVCSPRNVAVQVLVQSTAAALAKDHVSSPHGALQIVHVESEGVIDTRYMCCRKPAGEHHLQNIRIRIAPQYRKSVFTQGVQLLERDGYISDAKQWKKYKEERDWLTAKIMTEVRVVFVTTSSAAGTFLKYLSFLPSILIIDECGCAKPQDIAIPMMALGSSLKRIVLAGDPSQLPPLIFSKEAQKIWSKTVFAELIERGCKTTRLNTEYRSHSKLYQSTSQLFYQGTVRSHYDTVQSPPPMLVDLSANLPRLIPGHTTPSFQISGCSHFLNLPDGECFYCPGGSSENPMEADLAVSIAKSLCAISNVSEADIMILSGYTRQVHRIERVARERGLCNIRVKTVDGSQADDAPFVILSTVRSEGNDPGFMQYAARTNVATSRQKIALYIVGNWQVVTAEPRKGKINSFGKYVEYAQSIWPDYLLEAQR